MIELHAHLVSSQASERKSASLWHDVKREVDLPAMAGHGHGLGDVALEVFCLK